jgi:hypothetical protein
MATSDFYTRGVNDDNVLGGPVRIIVAQKSLTSYPEQISDVLDLSTYDPQTNWHDLGHTSEPFESSHGFDTTEWESQQLGVIDVQVGKWNRQFTVSLMEADNDYVRDLALEAYGRTTNADGDEVEYYWDQSDVTRWRVAALYLEEDGTAGENIVMDVFPNAKLSGDDVTLAWDRNNPQAISVTMRPFPDGDVPNKANFYRIRQQ